MRTSLRLYLAGFPIDVALLVEAHAATTCLQRSVRRWFLRHTRHRDWPVLRAHLHGLGEDAMRTLGRSRAVRREWTTEPESWLHVHEETVRVLVLEVQAGLWDGSSSSSVS